MSTVVEQESVKLTEEDISVLSDDKLYNLYLDAIANNDIWLRDTLGLAMSRRIQSSGEQ